MPAFTGAKGFRAACPPFVGGDFEAETLTTAAGELFASGDVETAAEAETILAELTWARGDKEAEREHMARAGELAAALPLSRVKVYVTGNMSRFLMLED